MDSELFDMDLLLETPKRIRSLISNIDHLRIYEHYVPGIKMGLNKSPFRRDNNASFSLFRTQMGIAWRDFAGFNEGGNVFQFVKTYYKVHKGQDVPLGNIEMLIYQDMKLQGSNSQLFFSDEGPRYHKASIKLEETLIQVRDEGWPDWAFEYWNNTYDLSMSMLQQYNVGHAKEVWVTPPGKQTYLWGVSIKEKPIYYFHFPETNHIKIYAPFNPKRKKWINNASNSKWCDVQGLEQLNLKVNFCDLIVLTKAMKEVMFYRKYHIDAIALHGEGNLPPAELITHLKQNSKQLLLWYDSDDAGMNAMDRISKIYDIPMESTKEAKNITDLWEKKPRLVFKYIEQLNKYYDR